MNQMGRMLLVGSLTIALLFWASGFSSALHIFQSVQSQGIRFQSLMEERKVLLETGCQNKSHGLSIGTVGDLFPLASRALVWCPVYKAASTTWAQHLFHLAGLTQDEIEEIKGRIRSTTDQAREVAPALPYPEVKAIMKMPGAAVVLIVRHPFTRLISAFRDKLERQTSGNAYLERYGRKMVRDFRESALEKFGEAYFSAENNFGAPFAPESGNVRTVDHPSWWEFVQWLIANKPYPERLDEHWRPFSLHCAVCSLPYNYIIKFENLWEEERGLFEEMGVADQVPQEWMNKGVGELPE